MKVTAKFPGRARVRGLSNWLSSGYHFIMWMILLRVNVITQHLHPNIFKLFSTESLIISLLLIHVRDFLKLPT